MSDVFKPAGHPNANFFSQTKPTFVQHRQKTLYNNCLFPINIIIIITAIIIIIIICYSCCYYLYYYYYSYHLLLSLLL